VKRLGSLLIDLGWITSSQLEHALQMQEILGDRLGTNLLELGAISEERLQTALAHQLGVPAARARDLRQIPREVHELLPAPVAHRWKAVPFRMLGTELHVAQLGAGDLEALSDLALATGREVRPFVGIEARLLCSLEDHYLLPAPPRIRQLAARLDREEAEHAASHDDSLSTPRPRRAHAPAEGLAVASTASPAPSGTDRIESSRRLAEWKARLDRLDDRDRIARAVLELLVPHFRRVVLLKLARGFARGWLGTGPGIDTSALRRLRIDLTEPSVLFNLARGSSHHVGTLPPMAAHDELASAWGGGLPGDCVVLGVRVSGRLVCAIFCEPGFGAQDPEDRSISVADLSEITDALGRAFARCVLQRRQVSSPSRPSPLGAVRRASATAPDPIADSGKRNR
jgi:hypothetical protein